MDDDLKKATEINDLKKVTEIKGKQMSVSNRGGKREGAGRPSKGIKRTIAITLPAESWAVIDDLIQMGMYDGSYAQFFRRLYETSYFADEPKKGAIPRGTDLNQTKVCRTCNITKQFRDFGYRTKKQDFTSECKSCSNEKKQFSALERSHKKRDMHRSD